MSLLPTENAARTLSLTLQIPVELQAEAARLLLPLVAREAELPQDVPADLLGGHLVGIAHAIPPERQEEAGDLLLGLFARLGVVEGSPGDQGVQLAERHTA